MIAGKWLKYLTLATKCDIISGEEMIKMKEIWKVIIDFPDYEVSNKGRVKNKNNGYIKKLRKTSASGWYYNVALQYGKKGARKGNSRDVHRLVAETFIPRVEGKNYVNHIDNNPTNNNVENLEWVTAKENVNHSLLQGRMRPMNGAISGANVQKRKVLQYNKQGEFIREYESLTKAAKVVGVTVGTLCGALTGKQKTSAGFVWKYKVGD